MILEARTGKKVVCELEGGVGNYQVLGVQHTPEKPNEIVANASAIDMSRRRNTGYSVRNLEGILLPLFHNWQGQLTSRYEAKSK